MDIGFIGLGKMGFPMGRRLVEAKHQLVVFDQRKEVVDQLVALGARAASSPKDANSSSSRAPPSPLPPRASARGGVETSEARS